MFKASDEVDVLYKWAYEKALTGKQSITMCGTQSKARSTKRAFEDRNEKSEVKMKCVIRKADDNHFAVIMKKADDPKPVPNSVRAPRTKPETHAWVIKNLTSPKMFYRTVPPLEDLQAAGGKAEWVKQTTKIVRSLLQREDATVRLIPLDKLFMREKQRYMAIVEFKKDGD